MRTFTLALLCCGAAFAAQPPLVPLLWTQGQPPETIRQAVREVSESGNTGFVWESRPHPDYLGPQWWSDLRVAVGEAKKLGLEVWIFDEWMYPSGVAGGRVVAQNAEFALHTIEDRSVMVNGPSQEKEWTMPNPPGGNAKVLSVVAFPQPFRNGKPVVLAASERVRWAAPAGAWRICWVVARSHPPRAGWSMSNMIDVMNPAATDAFIKITHEATWAHFRDDFGKTIKGFFSDETGFRNIGSYDSLPGKPDMRMPWSPIFREHFRKLKGYDSLDWLPALWYDMGDRGRMLRYDFVDACSRAFAENFFKPQQEWCHKHGVKFIGHLVEDNHADHNLGYGPGHWFHSIRYLDMPGIDVVGYQVTPGADTGVVAWQPARGPYWDQEFFSFGLPAMARGAALLMNTRDIFSEAFGANGWSEGLRMVKWIGDWHIVNGISVISPHAFTMKYNDPDCPPHFNRTGGTPQWRHYADWARPFARQQKIVASSDAIYEVAVLYTGESAWVGGVQDFSPVVRALELMQVSTVVLPYDAMEQATSKFRTIVLPYVRYIPGPVMEALARFAEAGGRVIVVDDWPEASIDARTDDAVKAAIARLKRAPTARLIEPWELPTLFEKRAIQAEPAMVSLAASHRKSDDGEWLILHNRSLASSATGRITLETPMAHATLYDAETNTHRAVAYKAAKGRLTVDIDMPPYAMWMLKLTRTAVNAAPRPVYRAAETLTPAWTVSKEDNAVGTFSALEDWRRWPGLDAFAGTLRYRATVRIARGAAKSIALDAGRVEQIAELKVNGKPLGAKIAPPYMWDITAALREGANDIEIEVTNTAQARWKDTFSHGDAASGLFGPVRILR